MPDRRLYVVAPTFQRFKAWCWDQGLSPNDPLIVDVLPSNWDHMIRGRRGIRYTVADWIPSDPRTQGLWPALEIHGAELDAAGLDEWVRERREARR